MYPGTTLHTIAMDEGVVPRGDPLLVPKFYFSCAARTWTATLERLRAFAARHPRFMFSADSRSALLAASHATRVRAAAAAPALALHGRLPAAEPLILVSVHRANAEIDVLVVGGGPAGSSAAWHLAREGAQVMVLDRARFPREKPCAEYLSPEASRILSAMGALEACEAAGAAHLAGMVIRAPSGARIRGEFAAAHGFRAFRDRGLALRRTVLDAILLDRARAAGAEVREGDAGYLSTKRFARRGVRSARARRFERGRRDATSARVSSSAPTGSAPPSRGAWASIATRSGPGASLSSATIATSRG